MARFLYPKLLYKIDMVKEVKAKVSSANSNAKLCAILSYLLVGVIWYFADEKMKSNSTAKYHAKQGLVLLIAGIIYSIILQMIISVLITPQMILTSALSGSLGLYRIISWLAYVPAIWVIIGIINAISDREKPLPLIGKFGEKFSF